MNRADFDFAVKAVRERAAVLNATYSEETFGSWVLTTAATPARRLVWDGKESWLIVQTRIDPASDDWKDVWMKRSAGCENLPEAVEQLTQ